MRNVWQSRYLISNWAYSTNHKRISINYFWFVLFSGVVGMVLATIIRLEMAYPGVGILAGDNSQYLSIVTAHGVIMVFFMAMPLLFGFFGNFLLPTQMGVHDVAFPRMNSAAFWFLPASLLALCQLVCVDRRYQRMNCFNVRELQSLLRNRFFLELAPSKLHFQDATFFERLLYKTNNIINSELSAHAGVTEAFLNPLGQVSQLKSLSTDSLYFYSYTLSTFTVSLLSLPLKFSTAIFKQISSIKFNTVYQIFADAFWSTLNAPSLISSNFALLFKTNIYYDNLSCDYFFPHIIQKGYSNLKPSESLNQPLVGDNLVDTKFNSVNNPELLYKIKTGNYLPGDQLRVNFSFLYTTVNKKSMFGHRADWFSSSDLRTQVFEDLIPLSTLTYSNVLNFSKNKDSNFTLLNSAPLSLFKIPTSVRSLVEPTQFENLISSLYFSQHKQVRVLNNWRSLKIQREGWRCRMLSARHQRSLYRRYVNENELMWVVEKNAKDLLPGWAMVTPFSSRTRYTLIGKTDIGICIVAITLIASMISSANFLMTYRYLSTLNNRKMRDARSFFTESVIAASWMMIAANPMLILGLFMLISDRHWKTCFFDYSGGGDTVLFQHMFWFFGHPEVYIIILPCFGIANTLLSFYLRKRISARASLLYSLYTIAFLGFFVWGHHMYMVGLAHTTRMLYSTLTVMISVPAATKIMHWLVTFVNSSVHFELPFILTLLFIFYFVSGGISGMAVAHTGMNILFHDTFYVIGHFHVMFAGSLMFAAFAAFYFYLPSLFGVRYSRLFAYLHVFYYSVGQIFTVIPMIWLGYLGMPRRVLDYPAAMGGWHSLISSAHIITVSGILAFVIMLFDSLRKQKSYTIKTFGVGRYNTRLNFYFYQLARNRYWISKHSAMLNVRAVWHLKNNSSRPLRLTPLDSTLFYYTFKPRIIKSTEWDYL